MDRQKNAAVFDHSFVALGFVFGNAHSNQRADQAAYHSSASDACQRAHNRACRDKGSEPWDGKCADSGQEAQRPTNRRAGRCARSNSFGGFRAFLVRKVFRADILRQEN